MKRKGSEESRNTRPINSCEHYSVDASTLAAKEPRKLSQLVQRSPADKR